ncbi:MAG: helix-turn-helix domain-containing protein [Dehalococcoidia bacterium]
MTMSLDLQPIRFRSLPQSRQRGHGKGTANAWTAGDDETLATYWGVEPDATVAARLGRTVDACKIRATRHLGLARKDAFYTSRQVAEILGIDSHRVVAWLRDGTLRGRQSAVSAGPTRMWAIDEPDLVRFLCAYPWLYDRTRIERGSYWRRVADATFDRDPLLTVPEAAARLGVSSKTVHRHLQRGWLRGVKRPGGGGGVWLVWESALSEFQPRHPLMLALGNAADQNRKRRIA